MISSTPFAKTYGLSPFFPPGTRNTDQRFKDFAKAIRGVWEPIVRAAQEDAAGDRPHDIGTINEIAVLHACEDALIIAGHRVDRSGAAESKMNARKAKVLKKLGQAEQAIDWQSRAAGDDTKEIEHEN